MEESTSDHNNQQLSIQSNAYFEEWRPLIGDIAHQLDQRIRYHVISGLPDELSEMQDVVAILHLLYLDNDSACRRFGERCVRIIFIRLMEILFLLRECGYSASIHGPFSQQMLAKYGRPNSSKYFMVARVCARHDPDHLKFLLTDLTANDDGGWEQKNVIILSNSLDAFIQWSRKPSATEKEKLFLEVSHQLDRRILKVVTEDDGEVLMMDSVQDFLDMLLMDCQARISAGPGKDVGKERAIRMLKRFLRVFLFLRPHGYVFERHAPFSRRIMGLSSRPSDWNYRAMLNWCAEEDIDILRDLLSDLATNEIERRDILVLFDCLEAFSKFYNCLMFSYD